MAEMGQDGTWAMPPGEGPCRTWPLPSEGCGCLPADPTTWDVVQRHAVEVATELLWRLTAGRFGLCWELVRPCPPPTLPPTPSGRHRPTPVSGIVVEGPPCVCPAPSWAPCHCQHAPDVVELPGPVHHGTDHPVRVWVDGHELPPDAYRVQHPNLLIRTGGDPWPRTQDLAAHYNEPGAFSIGYWRGNPVPVGGQRAVALLACELWKACAKGPDSCALPRRVQTVQREGITYTMIDPLDFLSEGRIGLAEVDMWVAAVNPGQARSPSLVLSPDSPRRRSHPRMGGPL